jgi:hypothetical protein
MAVKTQIHADQERRKRHPACGVRGPAQGTGLNKPWWQPEQPGQPGFKGGAGRAKLRECNPAMPQRRPSSPYRETLTKREQRKFSLWPRTWLPQDQSALGSPGSTSGSNIEPDKALAEWKVLEAAGTNNDYRVALQFPLNCVN